MRTAMKCELLKRSLGAGWAHAGVRALVSGSATALGLGLSPWHQGSAADVAGRLNPARLVCGAAWLLAHLKSVLLVEP